LDLHYAHHLKPHTSPITPFTGIITTDSK